jgi:DNA-binding response OmpR family regulator
MWPEQRRVQWDGTAVALTSTEFNLLEVLARKAGHTVSKQELSEKGLFRRACMRLTAPIMTCSTAPPAPS